MVVISRFVLNDGIKCCQLIENITGIMLLEKSIQNRQEKCDVKIKVSGENIQIIEILRTLKSSKYDCLIANINI